MKKDIKSAVEQEAIYLRRKFEEHDENARIYDYIGRCGYDDVNDFYWDKQKYLFKTQPFHIVEEPFIDLGFTAEYYRDKIPAFLYTIDCFEDYAFIPNDFENTEILEENGLVPLKIGYDARNGVIISSDGDLRIYLIYGGDIEVPCTVFLDFLKETLEDYFDNVVVDGNDILIDNKKVIGSVEFQYAGMNTVVFQCTFNDRVELIREICGVTQKTPGFIDPDIISPETLKDKFVEWLNQL